MKSPTSSLLRLRRGFTLIELLVVIVIIAILVGLALPGYNMVMRKMTETKTKHTMQSIITAAKQYQTDYNRLPIDPAEAASGTQDDLDAFQTDGTGGVNSVINILMADTGDETPNMNTRKIKYVDLPMAKNGLFGIVSGSGGSVGDGDSLKLLDNWGQPYWIQFDTDYNNRILNPDKQNVDPTIAQRATEYLTSSIIMYSMGPDKQQQTKDDIVSWR